MAFGLPDSKGGERHLLLQFCSRIGLFCGFTVNHRRGSGAEFDERLLPESTC